jgi:thiol-disulfide isomerase/thioredoxin
MKKKSAITQARGNIRPFHLAVTIVFLVLVMFSMGFEIWRRQNPGETLFTKTPEEGASAYFNVQNLAGRTQNFYSFTGRGYIILYLWKTSCGECLGEMAQLNQLATLLPREQVRVLTVALDENSEDVVTFLRQNNLTNLDAYRADGKASPLKSLKSTIVPARYFLNPKGEVLGMATSAVPWADPRVVETLRTNTTASPPEAP